MAVVADAESLSALGAQVWLHTYATQGIRASIAKYVVAEFTPDRFCLMIEDSDCRLVVAEHCGHLLGYSLVTLGNACPDTQEHQAELVNLYVLEHFSGRGIGTKLLRESEKIDGKLWLAVNVKNDRAIAFYEQRGYQKVGETDFHLDDEKHKNYVLVQTPA